MSPNKIVNLAYELIDTIYSESHKTCVCGKLGNKKGGSANRSVYAVRYNGHHFHLCSMCIYSLNRFLKKRFVEQKIQFEVQCYRYLDNIPEVIFTEWLAIKMGKCIHAWTRLKIAA